MKPTILIEDEVYRKVMHWVNKSDYEVSGLGMVKIEDNGVLRVVSAMLLPQENGSAHTDIEPEEVNKALFELRNSEGELRWWWHSHVKMGVFWSGTDHDTIKKLGEGGWFACTVFNQKKEVKSCYYSKDGQRTPWGTEPLMLDDLTTKVTIPNDPREAEWDAEYEKNVKIKKSFYSGGHSWEGKNDATTGTTNDGVTTAEFDPAVAPPLHRPKGMKKKTFKEWNSAHVKYIAGLRAVENDTGKAVTTGPGDQLKLLPPPPPGVNIRDHFDELGIDDYGFTQDERTILGQEGWDTMDIDWFVKEDFSPSEILRFAKLGVSASEIEWLLLNARYGKSDIMEMLETSESCGVNMFENPTYWRAIHVK